jgi:anti-sigma factor RsiW
MLSAMVDGELTASARSRVEAHLADCPACTSHLAELEGALSLLDQHQELEISDGFDAGFRRKLAATGQQEPVSRRHWWRLPALATLAATAAAAVLVVALHRGEVPGEPSPSPSPSQPLALADLALVTRLELLQDFEVVDNLDALEDFAVVSQLHELLEEEQP